MSERASQKQGVVFVDIPEYELPNTLIIKNKECKVVGHKRVKLTPLSEKEKAEGWRRVLPNVTVIDKKTGRTNRQHLSVKLCELPEHLWERMKPVYDNKLNKDIHYIVNDKCYRYKVQITPEDNLMRELYNYLLENEYTLDREYVEEVCEKLDSKGHYGWLMLRAKEMCARKH